jgi:hypothetical protein
MRTVVLVFAILATAPTSLAAAADQVPNFDIARNCAFEASSAALIQQTKEQTKAQCERAEADAKKQVSQEWSRFKGEAKRSCLQASSMGSEQSYVELQSCLEMSSNWNKGQTVGQSPSTAPGR